MKVQDAVRSQWGGGMKGHWAMGSSASRASLNRHRINNPQERFLGRGTAECVLGLSKCPSN